MGPFRRIGRISVSSTRDVPYAGFDQAMKSLHQVLRNALNP